MTTAPVFDGIYADNLWNGDESRSGPGSGTAATRQVGPAIELVVRAIDARSTLDVGCGDGLWMPELPGYTGIDPSAKAIERAMTLHPERDYLVWPGHELGDFSADLAICRDALQHLPIDEGRAILEAIAGAARWALVSTYLGTTNEDVPAGAFYAPNVTAEPFNWAMPSLLIFDGWDYETGDTVRDPRKFLGLWRLQP